MSKRIPAGFNPVAIGLLSCLLLHLIAHRVDAQEQFYTPAPDEYRIYGTAKDGQGQPLPEATASLVTLPMEAFDTMQYLLRTPAISSVDCENDGSFDIRISGDDKRWNAVNERTKHLLIVQAPGYETSITDFLRPRMLVELPLDVTTNKCSGLKLKVLDKEGSAVDNVEVRPAVLAGNKLSYQLDALKPATNLGEGFCQFDNLSEKALKGVYVSNPDGEFNFRLAVESKDGVASVQLPETGSVIASFEVPEGVDDTELDGKEVVVISGNLYQRNETSVEPISWSIKKESIKVRFDHVVYGYAQFGLVEANSVTLCQSLKDLAIAPTLTAENSPLEITQKLYPSRELKLRFVDESGNPIKTVRTSGFSGASDIADGEANAEGTITMHIAKGDKPSGQVFPFDTTGQYLVTSPFGILLDRMKMVDGHPEPVEMTRARSIRGRVTDEQGKIVAGAKVDYSIKSERFTQTRSVLSSVSGTFEIGGLPANTSVTIVANKGNLSTPTDANLSVMSGHMEEVAIPLVKQQVATISGSIMDQNGNPVSGANVKIYVANVSQEEGWGGESLTGADMIPDFQGVVSAADGSFRYPATTQFQKRFQVFVSVDGFRDMRYPFIDGQLKDTSEGNIDLGKFSLFKLPAFKETSLTVTNESGEPIKEAKIVFVGIDSDKQSITSDENGVAQIKLQDTCQLVAVKAQGYQLNLSAIEKVPDEMRLTLETESDPAERLAWTGKDWKGFHQQASELLQQLDVPQPKESTFYRQNMFFKSQLNTDFAAFKNVITNSEYEQKQTLLLLNASECFLHEPKESVELLLASELPQQQKAMLLANCALLAEDEDLKDEYYGEAIVMAGETSGVNQLMTIGSLADCLVIDGNLEVATELIAESWSAPENVLRKQLESKESKTRIGESRTYVPLLGLVDVKAAIDLTRLTASENELPGIVSQCLAYASIAGKEDLDTICKEKEIQFDATGFGQSRALMSFDLSNARCDKLAEWFRKHVGAMPNSTGKVSAIMFAARHMPAGTERSKLIEMAAIARRDCSPTYFWDDPAKEILEELPRFDSLTNAEYDELLFAAIEHAPAKINSYQLNMVFANLVKMVAVRDAKVAQQILEPAFENGAWRYGDPQWSAFEGNHLLKACAWIDPKFAAEKATELSEQFSGDAPVRKLQLLTSVIDEMNSIAIRKGMLE